jgi:hypothetical protein
MSVRDDGAPFQNKMASRQIRPRWSCSELFTRSEAISADLQAHRLPFMLAACQVPKRVVSARKWFGRASQTEGEPFFRTISSARCKP